MFMMQSMAIHPGDRVYIQPEEVIHNSENFDEPLLIVERAMSDSQMKDIGQVQAAKKPTRHKINSAYQQSNPRSQMNCGVIQTSQHVGKNNQIASERLSNN
ncbi:MAG TPA: hypothetical protein VIJ93_13075, partial [bacterium]